MSQATPKMRDLAELLIAYETSGKKSSATKTAAAFPVIERLRPHLASLMGNTGFLALLLRAQARAERDVPSLRAVEVKADGSLHMPDESAAQIDPENGVEGGVVLLAQLLGLLVTFIGEHLTLRLVDEIWPKLLLNNLDFDIGDSA